jgi:hypothetical protein
MLLKDQDLLLIKLNRSQNEKNESYDEKIKSQDEKILFQDENIESLKKIIDT